MNSLRKWMMLPLLSLAVIAGSPAGAERVVTKEPVLESDKPGAEKSRVYLPTLQDGPGKGKYIYIDKPNFRFVVSSSGECSFVIKDEQGNPYPAGSFGIYGVIRTSWAKPTHYTPKGHLATRRVYRHMIEVLSASQPTYAPSTVAVKAKLLDNVEFHWNLKAQGNTVEVTAGFNCPNKDYPSGSSFSMKFPATKKFPPANPPGRAQGVHEELVSALRRPGSEKERLSLLGNRQAANQGQAHGNFWSLGQTQTDHDEQPRRRVAVG